MIKAIVFDAYGTLFDVNSVGALAEQLFPGKGAELTALWRERQIDYSRLHSMAGRYRPFWEITADALIFAAHRLGLSLNEAARVKLMNQYACLSAFPESLGALRELKAMQLPLAILSNGTPGMLDIAIKSAGMTGLFDHVLSAETVGRYKPAPEVYRLGTDTLGVPARQTLFVSSNGWDACGATWFGYTAFWINRTGLPLDELGVSPAAEGRQMTDVVAYARRHFSR